MIPVLQLTPDKDRIEQLLRKLRLDPVDTALNVGERAKQAADVQAILADVARRGDDAVVDVARKFDDPNFTADQIRVTQEEMRESRTARARPINSRPSGMRSRSFANISRT